MALQCAVSHETLRATLSGPLGIPIHHYRPIVCCFTMAAAVWPVCCTKLHPLCALRCACVCNVYTHAVCDVLGPDVAARSLCAVGL